MLIKFSPVKHAKLKKVYFYVKEKKPIKLSALLIFFFLVKKKNKKTYLTHKKRFFF